MSHQGFCNKFISYFKDGLHKRTKGTNIENARNNQQDIAPSSYKCTQAQAIHVVNSFVG